MGNTKSKWSKGGKDKSAEDRDIGFSGVSRVQTEFERREEAKKKKGKKKSPDGRISMGSISKRAKATKESINY
jgi:hypothetical protein